MELKLVENRECGGCTTCCKTHHILSLDKPEREWCQHCDIGKGCRIYDTRPEECRVFKCGWLVGFGSEDERPDKGKCVADIVDMPDVGDILVLYELQDGAIEKSGLVKTMINLAVSNGMCILKKHVRARDQFLFPKGRKFPPVVVQWTVESRFRTFPYTIKKGRGT